MTLEETLTKIAADNHLTSVTIGRMLSGEDRIVWTANVHWDGFSARNIACQIGHSDISILGALEQALRLASADRAPSPDLPHTMPALVEIRADCTNDRIAA